MKTGSRLNSKRQLRPGGDRVGSCEQDVIHLLRNIWGVERKWWRWFEVQQPVQVALHQWISGPVILCTPLRTQKYVWQKKKLCWFQIKESKWHVWNIYIQAEVRAGIETRAWSHVSNIADPNNNNTLIIFMSCDKSLLLAGCLFTWKLINLCSTI